MFLVMDSIAIAINRSRRGFTLVELMVALAIGSIALVAILSLGLYSARSFAALTNYVDLDNLSRNALDQMTREIRQADRVMPGSDNTTLRIWVTPFGGGGREVTYQYLDGTGDVTRTEGADVRVLLRECFSFSFSYHQRKAGPDWEALPATTVDTCKQVRIFWECSRSILGQRANTESVQSAKVVIRKR
jgi:prepilin-type N-terminal cleavage/methylation domain-containing protein